jgi:hypothetical protein
MSSHGRDHGAVTGAFVTFFTRGAADNAQCRVRNAMDLAASGAPSRRHGACVDKGERPALTSAVERTARRSGPAYRHVSTW